MTLGVLFNTLGVAKLSPRYSDLLMAGAPDSLKLLS